MTLSSDRRTDRNIGGVCSRSIPDDRYIVAAVFVLMDDAGEFSTYIQHQPPMAHLQSSPLPSDELLMDVGALTAQAWAIGALTTTTEE
jgi:hypothetical protein